MCLVTRSFDISIFQHLNLLSKFLRLTGDIEPFIILGSVLRSQGFEIAIATNACFESDVVAANCKFYVLPGDPGAVMGSEEMKTALLSGSKMQMMKVFKKETEHLLTEMLKCLYAAVTDFQARMLVGTIVLVPEVVSVGQKLRMPTIICGTIPTYPTKFCRANISFIALFSKNLCRSQRPSW